MSYSIICDARKGRAIGVETLALVNRAACKSRWWTSDSPSIMMRFRSRSAAEYSLRGLRKNNPRIVPSDYAEGVLREQSIQKDIAAGNAASEQGWDGHKCF